MVWLFGVLYLVLYLLRLVCLGVRFLLGVRIVLNLFRLIVDVCLAIVAAWCLFDSFELLICIIVVLV